MSCFLIKFKWDKYLKSMWKIFLLSNLDKTIKKKLFKKLGKLFVNYLKKTLFEQSLLIFQIIFPKKCNSNYLFN
jgi:hypothetical protein